MTTLRSIIMIALIGAVAALCVLLSPPERLLLQRATKVTNEDSSWENDVQGYRWLSNQEAILLRSDANAKSYLVRLTLFNGTETRLPGWPSDEVYISSYRATKLQISPDHQWIFSVVSGVDTSSLSGGRLDGTHPLDYSGSDAQVGQVFWLSDSIHCLEFRSDFMLRRICHRISVMHPEATHTQTIELPLSVDTVFDFDLVSDHRVLGHEWLDINETKKDVLIADIRLKTNRATARTFRLRAPPNAKIQEMEFSPGGDRVAWLIEQEPDSTPATASYGQLPVASANTNPTVGIWVCRLNGTRMHEVGHLPLAAPPSNQDAERKGFPMPENVQWLPDGHRLSFIYKGALYIVPAD